MHNLVILLSDIAYHNTVLHVNPRKKKRSYIFEGALALGVTSVVLEQVIGLVAQSHASAHHRPHPRCHATRRGIRALMDGGLHDMIRRDEVVARHGHARCFHRYPEKQPGLENQIFVSSSYRGQHRTALTI